MQENALKMIQNNITLFRFSLKKQMLLLHKKYLDTVYPLMKAVKTENEGQL